ncbi:DUF3299 domain-containing protein [Hyphomonas sp.]|uniref:DUF3299 domain-containing protein n=1 Tax=Hyphomonas sp. TaxID=87 RepID=UPI00391BF103
MRLFRILLPLLLLAACSPAATETAQAPVAGADALAPETPATQKSDAPTQYWGVKPGEALPIVWQDLMPPGAEEELIRQMTEFYDALEKRYGEGFVIEEGGADDTMPQFGTFDVAHELDGQLVRIPGYVVPLDGTEQGRYTEFLFVPYMGACIHSPPPPPNQIILVRAPEGQAITDIWIPYYVEGTLSTGEFLNDTGNAAYALDFKSLEPYPIPEP